MNDEWSGVAMRFIPQQLSVTATTGDDPPGRFVRQMLPAPGAVGVDTACTDPVDPFNDQASARNLRDRALGMTWQGVMVRWSAEPQQPLRHSRLAAAGHRVSVGPGHRAPWERCGELQGIEWQACGDQLDAAEKRLSSDRGQGQLQMAVD